MPDAEAVLPLASVATTCQGTVPALEVGPSLANQRPDRWVMGTDWPPQRRVTDERADSSVTVAPISVVVRLGAGGREDLRWRGLQAADLGRVLDPQGDRDRAGGAAPGELDPGVGVAFGQAVAGRGQGHPDQLAAAEAAGGQAHPQP